MLTIRRYRKGEEPLLWTLFFNTVHNINIRDYSLAQVSAWAPHDVDPAIWKQKIQEINPFVAEWGGKIAGYADVQADGLIDHFFCDMSCQGKGIGRALMEALFDEGRRLGVTRYYAYVSITARPFFEHMGFTVVKEQQVDVRGAVLPNFVMENVRE